MSKSIDVTIEISFNKDTTSEITLSVDFQYKSGSPAHMGSLSYPGHPAEGPEIEIETVFWPIECYDPLTKITKKDHTKMPLSGLPINIIEAVETYIIENYIDESDCFDG